MSEHPYTAEQLATEVEILDLAKRAVDDLWRAGVLELLERDALAARLLSAIDRVRAAMTTAPPEPDLPLFDLEPQIEAPAFCFICGQAPCICTP